MVDPIQAVIAKQKDKSLQEKLKKKGIIYIEHRLMSKYGWIPSSELFGETIKIYEMDGMIKKLKYVIEREPTLKIPRVMNLLNVIAEEEEEVAKQTKKAQASGPKGKGRLG